MSVYKKYRHILCDEDLMIHIDSCSIVHWPIIGRIFQCNPNCRLYFRAFLTEYCIFVCLASCNDAPYPVAFAARIMEAESRVLKNFSISGNSAESSPRNISTYFKGQVIPFIGHATCISFITDCHYAIPVLLQIEYHAISVLRLDSNFSYTYLDGSPPRQH